MKAFNMKKNFANYDNFPIRFKGFIQLRQLQKLKEEYDKEFDENGCPKELNFDHE